MDIERKLTQDKLKEVLDYDKESGVFTWKIDCDNKKIKAGQQAGSLVKSTGYYVVGYDKLVYQAHRLAWLYVYGGIPEKKLIDHINGDAADNRISNLRLCTQAENQKNRRKSKHNTSGYKGLSWSKRHGKWRVRAVINRKSFHLGYYSDIKEAVEVYNSFCTKHHGDFYRDTTQ